MHTSCITEVERYEKRAPKQKNGKVPPQQQWMDLIAAAVATAPAHLKQHMGAMATLDNVPRKLKPFYNFTSNSLNLRGKSGEATVSEIWLHLSKLREEQQQQQQKSLVASKPKEQAPDVKVAEKEAEAVDEIIPKEPKCSPVAADDKAKSSKSDSVVSKDDVAAMRARASNDDDDDDEVKKPTTDRKAVKKAMKKVLKKAANRSLTVKLLRKLVREHLAAAGSDDKSFLKDLVQQNLDGGKTFLLQGKIVTLKK